MRVADNNHILMTMWHPAISKDGFSSTITGDDKSSSGKWLVPVTPLGDPEGVFEDLFAEVWTGNIAAIKKSTSRLDAILGHHLICVYCSSSDEATLTATLEQLRDLGIEGELQYKSDRATAQGRDEYLYQSSNFEPAIRNRL